MLFTNNRYLLIKLHLIAILVMLIAYYDYILNCVYYYGIHTVFVVFDVDWYKIQLAIKCKIFCSSYYL